MRKAVSALVTLVPALLIMFWSCNSPPPSPKVENRIRVRVDSKERLASLAPLSEWRGLFEADSGGVPVLDQTAALYKETAQGAARITINVASYRTPTGAVREASRLRGLGLSAYVHQDEVGNLIWYRVCLGRYPDLRRAGREAWRLLHSGKIKRFRFMDIEESS